MWNSGAQPKLVSTARVVSARRSSTSHKQGEGVYHLSPCDQMSITTSTARASFWKGQRFDAEAIERCMELLMKDFPFLAGRVALKGLKLGSAHISLSKTAGALLTVVEAPDIHLSQVGPDSWSMANVTLSSPEVPFYLDKMDGNRVLQGREYLMKVRLSRLADGDILGIVLSHCILDGMRWPAFLRHFAARYRQAVMGIAPAPEELLHPPPREELTSARLASVLRPAGGSNGMALPQVKPSLGDYWRTAGLLLRDGYKRKDVMILHIPKGRIQALKGHAVAANPGSAITTGDVAQALAGMLVGGAAGGSLLPLPPKYQVVLVQLQGVDPTHLGNSVHLLPVQVPDGAVLPAAEDYGGTLALLAGLIRQKTAYFRSHPEASVASLAHLEQLVALPIHKMLAFLAGHRLPRVTCTTNYIGGLPTEQQLDFGFGKGPEAVGGLVTPMGSDMATVRGAQPPYGEGLFVQLSLTPGQGRALRSHPMLQQLLPDATFLGDPAVSPKM